MPWRWCACFLKYNFPLLHPPNPDVYLQTLTYSNRRLNSSSMIVKTSFVVFKKRVAQSKSEDSQSVRRISPLHSQKKLSVFRFEFSTFQKFKFVSSNWAVGRYKNMLSNFDWMMQLYTTITVDEPAPGLKTIFSFVVPDQKSGKVLTLFLCSWLVV